MPVDLIRKVDRVNSEGVLRQELAWHLKEGRFVKQARRQDSCLVCCASKVNEAGLCDVCYSNLTEEELLLATRWLAGQQV